MGTKRDAEFFAFTIIDGYKASINTVLAAINAEKADGITLREVNSNAYYYLTFGQKMPAYDPAVVFGVETTQAGAAGHESSEELKVLVELVFSNQAEINSETTLKKVARYRRALVDIANDYLPTLRGKLAIESLPGVPFTYENAQYFAVGVGLTLNYVP